MKSIIYLHRRVNTVADDDGHERGPISLFVQDTIIVSVSRLTDLYASPIDSPKTEPVSYCLQTAHSNKTVSLISRNDQIILTLISSAKLSDYI